MDDMDLDTDGDDLDDEEDLGDDEEDEEALDDVEVVDDEEIIAEVMRRVSRRLKSMIRESKNRK